MYNYTSEDEILTIAKDIQNACNPIAIAHTLAAVCKYLVDQQGTDYARTHPATRAIIGKLADLSGIDHDGIKAYDGLYK
jgi:hypothetical protein